MSDRRTPGVADLTEQVESALHRAKRLERNRVEHVVFEHVVPQAL